MPVRLNKSATLYLRVLDARGRAGRRCACARCLGACLGEYRDRRYGFPKRYGMKTAATTRRVDRIDPGRQLY